MYIKAHHINLNPQKAHGTNSEANENIFLALQLQFPRERGYAGGTTIHRLRLHHRNGGPGLDDVGYRCLGL
jgi:hypothetical protein